MDTNVFADDKLIPLEVPWMLGLESHFEIAYSEGGSLFVEVNGSRITGPRPSSVECCRVEIVFNQPNQFGFGLGYDEADFVDLYEYVSEHQTFGSDDDLNLALYELWFQTDKCPDPFAYEVGNSSFLAKQGLDPSDLREFLLCGNEASLRVIARGYSSRILNKQIKN